MILSACIIHNLVGVISGYFLCIPLSALLAWKASSLATRNVWEKQRTAVGAAIRATDGATNRDAILRVWVLVVEERATAMADLKVACRMKFL